MNTPTQISPQWVAQVLRDRGIKPPAILSIQRFLGALSDQDRSEVYADLHKVELGVDDPDRTHALVEKMGASDQQSVSITEMTIERAPAGSAAKPVTQAKTKPPKASAATAAKPWYRSHGEHIYATSAAMKVELDILKTEADAPTRYTVQIELAPAKAARAYDWDSKIAFQFTRRELPLLAAMLMGYLKRPLSLSNHGPDRNKSLDIQDHGTNRLFVRARQAGHRIAMPVFAEDVHVWLTIAMQALKHNNPDLDGSLMIEMLRRTAAIHDAPDESKGGANQ